MKQTDRTRTALMDIVWILSGAAAYALSVVCFSSPNHIAPGGVTGIATLLNHLFSFPIGTTAFLLNIPLFLWGLKENSLRFFIKTAGATALCSVLIDVFSLVGWRYVGDRLLSALFAGVFSGAGLGMIFSRGCTTGGTDIIARNLNRRLPFLSMGSIILCCDAVVVILSAVVYGSLESALYAVIMLFVSTKVIDELTYGFSRDNGKLMLVVTDMPELLSKSILREIRRGVTVLRGAGAYSKKEKGVLLIALRPTQVFKTKALITKTDPRAFLIVTTATAILGEGFRGNTF